MTDSQTRHRQDSSSQGSHCKPSSHTIGAGVQRPSQADLLASMLGASANTPVAAPPINSALPLSGSVGSWTQQMSTPGVPNLASAPAPLASLGLAPEQKRAAFDPVVLELSSASREQQQQSLLAPSAGLQPGQALDFYSAAAAGQSLAKRQRTDESGTAYRRSDPSTFIFDVQRLRGPVAFFQFSQLLCHFSPLQGVFLARPSTLVPPSWCLTPADLAPEWLRHHLAEPTSKTDKANKWKASVIWARTEVSYLRHQTQAHLVQPDLNYAFFREDNIKNFVDPALWIDWELGSAANVARGFTAAHFLLLAPD